MRILHVVHNYHPSIGGSQWLVQNLSERLAADYGDDVTVFTTNALNTATFAGRGGDLLPPGLETINGVTVRRFAIDTRFALARKAASALADRLRLPGWDRLRTLHNGPLAPGLQRAVAESGAEVVMAMAFPLRHMFDARAGAKRAKTPIVFIGAIHPADSWGFDRPMIYRAIQQADAYIALSPFEKEYLAGRGVAPEKIAVIGAGVDLPPSPAMADPAARARFSLPDAPVILALGKQNARKRLLFLLQAMQSVWTEHPAAHLVLAGATGDTTPELRRQAARLDYPVKIINNLSEQDKGRLLSICDFLVLPSTEESFGIVFLEAWAHGKPVIGANAGAIATLIADDVDGLLFQPENPASLAAAISTLLANPARRAQLGAAGKQKVHEKYTWGAIVAAVRSVYTQVSQ